MRTAPARTRSFVMVLVAWIALSLAPVVALAPSSAAAFAIVAAGLTSVVTLRLSLRWGVGAAVLSIAVFALADAEGSASPWSLPPDAVERLGRSLIRGATLAPDLLTAMALLGSAASADLASAGLEWGDVFRRAVRQPLDRDDEPRKAQELPEPGRSSPRTPDAGLAGAAATAGRRPPARRRRRPQRETTRSS